MIRRGAFGGHSPSMEIEAICTHALEQGESTWRCKARCRECGWRGVFVLKRGQEHWSGMSCPDCHNPFYPDLRAA